MSIAITFTVKKCGISSEYYSSQISIPYGFWAKTIKTFTLTNNVAVVE